jgi:hypothetical protein
MSKNEKNTQPQFLFGKRNYMFMLIGLACIALGFILMGGGGSDDPNVWNDAINNFQRIRLAPTLVIIGLGIQIYAIMLNPNKDK